MDGTKMFGHVPKNSSVDVTGRNWNKNALSKQQQLIYSISIPREVRLNILYDFVYEHSIAVELKDIGYEQLRIHIKKYAIQYNSDSLRANFYLFFSSLYKLLLQNNENFINRFMG